jgi:hypothetical protein
MTTPEADMLYMDKVAREVLPTLLNVFRPADGSMQALKSYADDAAALSWLVAMAMIEKQTDVMNLFEQEEEEEEEGEQAEEAQADA